MKSALLSGVSILTILTLCISVSYVVGYAAVHQHQQQQQQQPQMYQQQQSSQYSDPNKILLKDVQVQTFQKGLMTTGRRSVVPQLNCIGGDARYNANEINSIQCTNMGFNGNDYDWECKATMSDYYKLGRSNVICEGYDSPNDPYILKGSCGIEYELEYTPKYHQRHNNEQTVTTTTHEYGTNEMHGSSGAYGGYGGYGAYGVHGSSGVYSNIPAGPVNTYRMSTYSTPGYYYNTSGGDILVLFILIITCISCAAYFLVKW